MIFDYLYYKLYQATTKGSLRDIPQYIAPIYFGLAISANIMVVNAFLAKIDIGHFLFTNPKQGGGLTLICIIIALLYYKRDRRESVLEKYSQESNRERIKGNTIVAIYVALSFLLIFAVAFFRPGKL